MRRSPPNSSSWISCKRNEPTLDQSLDSQRAAIADLLRATYAVGQGSDLRLLLGDEDVARIARSLAYSKYFQQDRLQKVQQLMTELTKLQDLETQITTEQQALQATAHATPATGQCAGAATQGSAKTGRQIDAQYKNEAQRLAGHEAERAIAERTAGRNCRKPSMKPPAKPARRARANPTAARWSNAGKALANIRGNLPWPAAGAVHNFGNGVLIAAPRGSEVHAVAAGRVVYAALHARLRQLIILNHGNGWMSMYGNNETLLHGVGDDVAAGEALGTAALPPASAPASISSCARTASRSIRAPG